MLVRRVASEVSVLASYVRVTRNSSTLPFVQEMSDVEGTFLEKEVTGCITDHYPDSVVHNTSDMPLYERERLSCRYTVSDKLLALDNATLIEIPSLQTVIALNYIDHFRIGSWYDGPGFEKQWRQLQPILTLLDDKFEFSAREKYGYLSPRLKNCGLGLRLSVLIHLPGLDQIGEIRDTTLMLEERGYHLQQWNDRDDSDNCSHLFYLSTAIGYGVSEEDLIKRFEQGIDSVLEMEFNALVEYADIDKEDLADRVSRSYGILRYSQKLTYSEALEHISNIRMALEIGHETPVSSSVITELFYQVMNENIAKVAENETSNRDIVRAERVREILQKGEQ
jgi:protein arginine kinase